MSFWYLMICYIYGIQVVLLKWCSLDGMVGVFWQVEGYLGVYVYYLLFDLCIMIFFNDVLLYICMLDWFEDMDCYCCLMMWVFYVFVGVLMWISFILVYCFLYLDLYIEQNWLLCFLMLLIGWLVVLVIVWCLVEIQNVDVIEVLVVLLVDEFFIFKWYGFYVESLVGSIVVGLLEIGGDSDDCVIGGLMFVQLNKLVVCMDQVSEYCLIVVEMVVIVGLLESWFVSVFKKIIGQMLL